MNLEKFLVELKDLGVTLTVQDGKLRSQGAKGALTPALQSTIREHKEEIIEFLSGLLGGGEQARPIERVERNQALPLSFAQQRLWFIDQFDPGSSAYNIATAVRLFGHLDTDALCRALNEIVRRHEALRTTFVAIDGTPMQVIAPALSLAIPVKDLSAMPHGEQESQVQWLTLDEFRTPFDLEKGPLIRARLIKRAAEEHLLLFTMHHIVADGWSMGVLVKELALLYGAQGRPSPLPELAIQYADFASWQRACLDEEALGAQLNYWKNKLEGAPALLALPTDYPRPAVRRHEGAAHVFSIPARTTAGLQALSNAAQATLFMTLAAAFNVLLARYTGQDDICLGTVIANRNRTEVEPLIGLFANTLVLRTRIEGNPAFGEVLQQLRTTALEAYAHQDMPFEQLVDALKLPRSTNHSPLFQVSFALQNTPMGELALPGLRLQLADTGGTAAKFDLALTMTERAGTLEASLEYDVDLFERGTIERMAAHFTRLLDAIVADPDCPVHDLPLMDAAETERLLAWSSPRAAAPDTAATIHGAFETQVARTPDGVALACGDEQLSYAELNARANRLAHFLRSQGVGNESLVGLFVDRSLDMVVALLAVLKAGGAYLPLDPSYPKDRLAFMLEDARPAVLLTQQRLSRELPDLAALGGPPIKAFCIDTQAAEWQAFSSDNPDTPVLPGNLAYVIYTSGSTGKPKGALLQHDNVLRLFAQTDAWFGFGSDDIWSLFHSYAFDFSVWEIWGALLHGGKLVIVPFDVSRSPAEFHALLAREKVTVLNQTPSAFQQLLEVDLKREGGQALSLRYVIFGGEALNRAALEPWFAAHGYDRPALVNMYGITETTVHVTYQRLRPAAQAPRSVGKPIADLGAYILDARLNLAPVGVVGELHVAGAGLARAYLNRPGLTAERFIPNPFSDVPGSRLYKSGDLARYLPDGDIEYLGRADSQVKLRGFRIEIGEIEAVLSGLPGIREAVVLAREDEAGEKSLVAYVVAEAASAPGADGHAGQPHGEGFLTVVEQEQLLAGTALEESDARRQPAGHEPAAGAGTRQASWSQADLRAALLRRLPEYMVPAHFCLLESLPLTGNGKVDRKALPAPAARSGAGKFVAPRTAVEETVAGIWRSVLKLDRVGVEDNFFECGGHSLRATIVLAHVNKAFGVEIGVRALFEAPTVAGLARHIEAAQRQHKSVPSTIERVPPGAAYAISAAQRRLWLLHKIDPANTAHHGMALLELPPDIERAALERALGAIVERHEVLRTVFREGDGVLPQQVIEAARPVFLRETVLGSAQALRDHVRQFVARPFDFEQGPLFRVEMLHTWDGRRLLLSCMHEVVADGSSTAVLQHEVMELLQADLQGRAARLPELPIQYKDFAAWQNGLLRGESGEASRQYWHALLGAELPRLQLPFDAAPTLSTSNRGARYHFSVSGDTYNRLASLCLERGVTLFMLLQASLSVLFARLTGQRDISMVTPVAGRNAAELQPLIGFFLNTLLLRTQVDTDECFADLLMRVREATLQALEHQHYPFEQLIEELNLPRPANQFPVTPVLFNVLSFRDRSTPYRLPPAGHCPLDQDMKIELELTVQEHADVLAFQCDYRSALFKPETIEYLMQQWLALIEQIVQAPRTEVGAFALFAAPQALALQSPYLRFASALPAPAAPLPVLARLQQVTDATPDAVALEWRDRQWSYARLAVESNRVARRLHELGLARGDVVGLLLDDPLSHIAAVIGVMKAGGVFVAFDPADPAARLRLLVEAAAPGWWVVEPSAADAIAGVADQLGQPPRGIWIGDAEPPAGFATLGDDARAVHAQANPNDPCYIFFTSGSTGKPKPILGQAQSLAHFIEWEIAAFRLDASVRVSQLTAPTFDAFLRDLFVPLCTGGTLCLPPAHRIAPDQLMNWLEQARVSLVHCVPSVLRNLLAYLQLESGAAVAARLPSLQRICLSGEVLLPATVQAWQACFGSRIELVNFYGASETTMIRCFHRITAADIERGFIPVGKPIADTQVIVLDPAGQPCAPGTPGEIFIRSPFFTLGYHRSPAMTAAVFVPNPLRPHDAERVYRTGDMGLFLPDGSLRFLGRRDGQVKVNGVRVEIGEIENALLSHPQVVEAAVVAQTAADGATTLHAYVVAGAPLSVPLRGFLAERMAVTSIPQSFTELESLPMTSSGKVDRKALSQREAPAVVVSAAAYAAPTSATERTLITLYEEVLKRDGVGVHDDFFALGGHSLRALLLLSRIRQAFGVEVALRILFESPTVAQMANVVDGLAKAAPHQDTAMESLLSEVQSELASMIKAAGQDSR